MASTGESILFLYPCPPGMRKVHLPPGLVAAMGLAGTLPNVHVEWYPVPWHELSTDLVAERLRQTGCRILASPVYSDGHYRIERIIQGLLAARSAEAVIVGGPHIDAVGDSFMKGCRRLFRSVSPTEQDVISLFGEAIEAVTGRRPTRRYPAGSKARLGHRRIAYEILEGTSTPEWRSARPVLVTSLGCNRRCTFCAEPSRVGRILFRAPDVIEAEVSWLSNELDYRFMMIADDNILACRQHAERVTEILHRTSARHPDLRCFLLTRPEDVLQNEDIVRRWPDLHVVRVQIGLESGCLSMRRRYGKPFSTETIRKAVKILFHAGIPSIVGSFILGGPFETRESVEKTASLIVDLIEEAPGVFEPDISYLRPYPSISLLRRPSRGLRAIAGIRLGNTVEDRPFFETPAMTEAQLFQAREDLDTRIRGAMISGCDRVAADRWAHKNASEQEIGIESLWSKTYKEAPNCLGAISLRADLRGPALGNVLPAQATGYVPRCTVVVPNKSLAKGSLLPLGRSRGVRISPQLTWLLAACNGERTLQEVIEDYANRFGLQRERLLDEVWPLLVEFTTGNLLVWETRR